MNRDTKFVVAGGGIILILVTGLWWASPKSQRQFDQNSPAVKSESTAAALNAEEAFFDFGTVSMKSGTVTHAFRVANDQPQPVTVAKIYTSCMCTTASLVVNGERVGPYGMPGHGPIPRINKTIAPGESAQVEVMFDPAAHGPSGVGPIERLVYLEQPDGNKLSLQIKAMVTP